MKPEYLNLIKIRLENILADNGIYVVECKLINEYRRNYHANRILSLVLSESVKLDNEQIGLDCIGNQSIIDKLYDKLLGEIGYDINKFQIYSTGVNILIVESPELVNTSESSDFLKRCRINKDLLPDSNNPCLTEDMNYSQVTRFESEGDIQYQLWIEQEGKIIHQGKVADKVVNDLTNHTLRLKFPNSLNIDTREIFSVYRIKIFEYTIKERAELGDIIRGSQEVIFDKNNVVLDKFNDINNTYEFIY